MKVESSIMIYWFIKIRAIYEEKAWKFAKRFKISLLKKYKMYVHKLQFIYFFQELFRYSCYISNIK